jgi:hypothetical protein
VHVLSALFGAEFHLRRRGPRTVKYLCIDGQRRGASARLLNHLVRKKRRLVVAPKTLPASMERDRHHQVGRNWMEQPIVRQQHPQRLGEDVETAILELMQDVSQDPFEVVDGPDAINGQRCRSTTATQPVFDAAIATAHADGSAEGHEIGLALLT